MFLAGRRDSDLVPYCSHTGASNFATHPENTAHHTSLRAPSGPRQPHESRWMSEHTIMTNRSQSTTYLYNFITRIYQAITRPLRRRILRGSANNRIGIQRSLRMHGFQYERWQSIITGMCMVTLQVLSRIYRVITRPIRPYEPTDNRDIMLYRHRMWTPTEQEPDAPQATSSQSETEADQHLTLHGPGMWSYQPPVEEVNPPHVSGQSETGAQSPM